MIKASIKQTVFTLLFLVSFSNVCNAASFSGNVKVSILDTFDFVEQKVVDFGVLSLSNGTCTMGKEGVLSASNGSTCAGEGQLGQIAIEGTEDQTVSISVESGNAGPGIKFTPELLSASTPVLSGGKITAEIGGALNVDSAKAGDFNLTYVVVVNYN